MQVENVFWECVVPIIVISIFIIIVAIWPSKDVSDST